MVQHHLGRRGRHAALDHLVAKRRVSLHREHLGRRQPRRLVENLLGHSHLADVVQQASQPEQVQVLGLPRRFVTPLVDQVAVQFHSQQQGQVADVGRVRHQVVVEGVEFLQEDVAAGAGLEEIEQVEDGGLEMDQVDLGRRVAEDGLEVLPHVGVDFALPVGQPLVDDLLEEFQLPMADPDFQDAHLRESRDEIHGDLHVALQQIAKGIVGQRHGTGQNHARPNLVDGNSQHRPTTIGGPRNRTRPT